MRLDPVALAQRARELAQAPDALAEHDHLLLTGDSGERLGGDAAQQRQPIPAATNGLGDEALADERGRERGLRVGQRLGVDARVDEDPDVAQDDSLRAGEFGERLPVEVASGFERLQLAQDLEQSPVGVPSALADRVEQLGERRVGVERERLRGPDFGHPRLHVAAGDADEVWAIVDAQAVGVDLVHQVARLARVEPLADHRLVADREPDEHVEVLGGLPARGRGQEPAVGDRSEPDLRERLVRLGRGVRVAQRLVGDQQVPGDRLQVGRVAVEHAVRGEHHPGRSPSSRSNRRICPAICRSSARTSSSRFGASGGSPRPGAPRVISSRH